jgi:glycosyltransferase involved in cell wall biosynthesis
MAGISACIIARDEEGALPRCLASIRPWVDQICLLDTGSRDATIKIARSFGADVSSAKWQDDFSIARNLSLDMAREPWILVIDADEELDQATGPRLRGVLTQDRWAFLLTREDLRPQGPAERIALARIFRNDPGIRFRRPVHESIMDSLFEKGAGALDDSGVRLLHYGYLPEVLRERDKHGRNLAILRRQCLDAPDDLYSVFKLAVTLPVEALDEKLRAFAAAHALAERLTAEEEAELPFLASLCDAYAALLATRGELTLAIDVADRGRARHPDSAQLDYRRGELARAVGDVDLATRLFRETLNRPRTSAVRADRSAELRARCLASVLAMAVDAGKPTRETSAIDASVREMPAVRVGELRLLLLAGRAGDASAGLGPLLESHFHDDDVKLFGGELAWAQRDFDTAFAVWSLTRAETDAGHRARAWLKLLALSRGQAPLEFELPRDVAAAAMMNIVRVLAGQEDATFDGAFLPSAVRRWTDRWISELAAASADGARAAVAFRARSGRSISS